MEDNKFQNIPSKRLYEFLLKKVDKKEVTMQQIADTLDVYKKNPASYFHALRTGTTSVKLDHILKAQEHFGLNPCDLFKATTIPYGNRENEDVSILNDPASGTYADLIGIIKSQQQTIHFLATSKGNMSAPASSM